MNDEHLPVHGTERNLIALLVCATLLFAGWFALAGCGDASNGVGSPDSCDVCRNVVSGVDAGDAAK